MAIILLSFATIGSASDSALLWRSADQSSFSHSEQPRAALRDDQVVAAAWEEADAAQDRSVVVKRWDSGTGEADHTPSLRERFAQLPDDPFDDPAEEPMPEPELEEVQEAVEEELDRRDAEADYDPFDDPEIEAAPVEEDIFGDEPEEDDIFSVESDQVDSFESFKSPTLDTPTIEDHESRLFDEESDNNQEEMDADDSFDDSLELDTDDFDLELTQPSADEQSELQNQILARERAESEESCAEEIERLRSDRIDSIDLSIRVEGSAGEDYPYECSLVEEDYQPRQWPQITYMWKASALCHKPLYFEQVHLERYGHSWGPYTQPIMSGVHFFGTLPILPYKMGLRTPTECVYSLGYYRPGSCAPYLIDSIPFTWRAAAFQTGFVTGATFTIP